MASGTVLAGFWTGSSSQTLTRDFTAMVGEPPTRYAQRYPNQPAPAR